MSESSNSAWPFGEISDEEGLDIEAIFKDSTGADQSNFVPRTHMDQVDIFEDFITLLSGLNKRTTPLIVNSFYIIDDAKQREKMTEEFYNAVKKEIAVYQEKCDYLIKSNSQSPAIMDRWILKVQALEEKKRHYEGVLQRELDGLDDEFSVLKLLSQELQVRANGIRDLRFRQKAA